MFNGFCDCLRSSRLWLALAGTVICAAPASADEIWLYDGQNFTGEYRVLIGSEPDLDRIEFDNRVGSVRVLGGSWVLHRDDGFGNGSGPALALQPGEYPSLPALGHPDDRMSSVQQTASSNAQLESALILYDGAGFSGSYRVLTASEGDFRRIGFDNRVRSLRVLAGGWSLHRDFGFQDGSGPSLQVVPGDIADITALGYPDNRMSAARLAYQATVAPQCPAPYQAAQGNRCVFTCAAGTQPDPASGQCLCQAGFQQTGLDPQGRRVCGPVQLTIAEPPAIACPANSVLSQVGCVCVAGAIETGRTPAGQPVCLRMRAELPTQPTPPAPAQQQDYVVPGAAAVAYANSLGLMMTVENAWAPLGHDCSLIGTVVTGYFRPLPVPMPTPTAAALDGPLCDAEFFAGGRLAPGWLLTGAVLDWRGDAEHPDGEAAFAMTPTLDPSIILRLDAVGPFVDPSVRLVSITLRGPAGADWHAAFTSR